MKDKLDIVLDEYKEEINGDVTKVQPIVDYVCMFCGKTYGELEHVNEHLLTCLRNMYDVKSCVTCKHACYNLVPTYGKTNGYERLVSEGITSNYGYFTCERKNPLYHGKLSEEKVLRDDKECYEPLEYGENFMVKRTEQYERYMDIMEQIDVEQSEIDGWIEEFWTKAKDLQEQGYSENEVLELLEKEYEDE